MKTSKKSIAILTPTYNRSSFLSILYNSLVYQKSKNFKWYIIDDGSSDDTEKQIKGFITNEFEIVYVKKTNGGKHTALNLGIQMIEEELVFIVDSDDYLTEDATEEVERVWNSYKDFDGLCGLSFLKMFNNGDVVGDSYSSNDLFISDFISERVNKNVRGDKAEIWVSSILKKYPFPVYEGEKFLSEAVVWNKMSSDGYKMVFVSKPIYVCEYHDDGLTKSGRKLRLNCPLGTIDHAFSYLTHEIKLRIKFKYLLYLNAISIYSKKIKYVLNRLERFKFVFILASILGAPLALFWRIKYGR